MAWGSSVFHVVSVHVIMSRQHAYYRHGITLNVILNVLKTIFNLFLLHWCGKSTFWKNFIPWHELQRTNFPSNDELLNDPRVNKKKVLAEWLSRFKILNLILYKIQWMIHRIKLFLLMSIKALRRKTFSLSFFVFSLIHCTQFFYYLCRQSPATCYSHVYFCSLFWLT